MKYHILFSRKNKKNISKCHLMKVLHSMQIVKELHQGLDTVGSFFQLILTPGKTFMASYLHSCIPTQMVI